MKPLIMTVQSLRVNMYIERQCTGNLFRIYFISDYSYRNCEISLIVVRTKICLKISNDVFLPDHFVLTYKSSVSPCHSDHLGLTNEEVFLMNHVNYIPYPNIESVKFVSIHLNL